MRRAALLDSDWKFHLGDIDAPVANKHISAYMANKAGWAGGAARGDFDDSDWRRLSVPHDWSVEGAFDPENHVDNGFLPRGIGWYRRHFRLEESDRGKYLALQFDGVARHCTVFVNGHALHRNFCGYTPFTVEIGDVANFGEELNVVAVRVDATPMEGWWYEGAGIYRDVWLIRTGAVHVDTYGVIVCPKKVSGGGWETNIETSLVNSSDEKADCRVEWKIEDDAGKVIGEGNAGAVMGPRASSVLRENIRVDSPRVWSLEEPARYWVKTVVTCNGEVVDEEATYFGYRTIRFDAQEGFFLNERAVKLNGTCNHQDHAGVGVAVPDSIQEFRIRRLLEMGSNAYRCAHNPPSPSLLEACDRLGMLVMDENRNFGSSPEHLEQLRTMVRRDRNHPCVILWSICNEEAIQGTSAGGNIARAMQHAVKELDDSRPVTAAVSGGILSESGIGSVVEVMGLNYQLPLEDAYHGKFPRVPLVASETECVLSTRGVYETNAEKFVFASDDSEFATWGATARETWKHISTRSFVAGGFVWTGFDYRGEPTPHAWPCVNSHFGIMDVCGFAKDGFYLHKAMWGSERFVHLLPHWNWEEGKLVKVMAFTNCAWAELFLNGKSLGKQRVEACAATWEVAYRAGELKVVAFDSEGEASVSSSVKKTGAAVGLGLEIHPAFDAQVIPADGRFAIPVTVYAVDAEGNRVPTANQVVAFSVKGLGNILGVGNGDPVCHEPDKGVKRSLFNGLAQVILQTTSVAGQIELSAEAVGLQGAVLRVRSSEAERVAVPAATVRYLVSGWRMSPITAAKPDVGQQVMEQDMNSWDRVDPAAGPQEAWGRGSGYAIYRANCKVPKFLRGNGGKVAFREITGEAEVFIDGIVAGKKVNSAAGELAVSFPAGVVQFVLSVVMSAKHAPAGISKHVEIHS